MGDLVKQAWNALFLSEAPYARMQESERPALRGLGVIVVIALIVALLGLIGTTLEWATSPKLTAIRDVVYEGIQQMPWYLQLKDSSEFQRMFTQQFDLAWRILPALFGAPSIGGAAANIILLPLSLVIRWLIYGLLAYGSARAFGGRAGLGQTLGAVALTTAPQMLNAVTILPYVAVGGIVGTWTLLCRYIAIKATHRLPWGKTLAITLLPSIIIGLVVGLFACLASVLVGALVQGGMAQ